MRIVNIKNFRDIKGYSSQDGFVIKPYMIFRGGALDKLTIKEQNHFVDHLKIKYILDFRDEAEASLAPDKQHENILYERISALKMQSHDQYGFDFGTMLQGEMSR